MEQHAGRWSAVAAAALLAAACGDSTGFGGAGVEEQVFQALAADDTVDVIVSLRAPSLTLGMAARRDHIARAQQGVLSRHGGFAARHRYRSVPALAGRLSRAAFDALASDPDVAYVQLDAASSGHLYQAVPATGADRIRGQLGLSGKGVRVAILDTGVDTTHPDLRGSIVAQHCFTHGDCPPNHTNEGGSAEDDHGHGSNVAGVVSADGVVGAAGFAPDAELVVVKVIDSGNAAFASDEVAGLDWIYENLDTLGVQVVNMSV